MIARAADTVVITHPDKVLFPEDGITKGQLAAYYEALAPIIVPHLRGRPVTMERYPSGIGKKGFWQKDVSKGFPVVARARRGPEEGRRRAPSGRHRHAIADVGDQPEHDHAAHLGLASCRTCITPTSASSISIRRMTTGDSVRAAALGLRDLLDKLSLPSWVKTSGSKGFHIVVPLDGSADMGQVARFADGVGELFVTLAPEALTREFAKVDRRGRIYVDTGRNGYSATFAAPYTVRARPGAPVSAPCTWEEIEHGKVDPGTFTLRNMPERIEKVGDLWADMKRRGRVAESADREASAHAAGSSVRGPGPPRNSPSPHPPGSSRDTAAATSRPSRAR